MVKICIRPIFLPGPLIINRIRPISQLVNKVINYIIFHWLLYLTWFTGYKLYCVKRVIEP